MRRRRFLALGSSILTGTLTGCNGDAPDGTTTTTTADSATMGTDSATRAADDATTADASRETTDPAPDLPDGIYVQSFRETMSMQGRATAGDYAFALMFTVPHTFWTVTGRELSRIEKTDTDSIHLMAVVWDRETRTVLPESGLSVEIARDGSLVSEEVIYPMLSQPMGFHYGGNFELPGDGTYTVEVSVGGTTLRRTGAFEGQFGAPASVEIPLSFTGRTRRAVSTRQLDQGGQPGALRPRDSELPRAIVPAPSSLPGTVRGRGLTDGARLVVTTLEDASRVGAPDSSYLAVSARTRYNRYVLPAMALTATLDRDGQTVYDGPLERTLSPDLGYHYGVAVDSVRRGDELTLSVTTPPQVARHEGYERAFRQMDDVRVTF